MKDAINSLFQHVKGNLVTIAALACLGFVVFGIMKQTSLNYYAEHHATVFREMAPAVTLDTDFHPKSVFHGGDGVVLDTTVFVDAKGCSAVYNQFLSGPVIYQFPATHTARLYTNPELRHVRVFFELPKQLPAGEYDWKLTVFPSCENFILEPTTVDYQTKITIVR